MSSTQRYLKRVYSGFEPCHAHDIIMGGQLEHRLLAPQPSRLEHQRLSLDGIHIDSGTYSTSVAALGTMPADTVCIGLFADQPGHAPQSDTADLNSGIHIYPAKAEFFHRGQGPSVWHVLAIDAIKFQKILGSEMRAPSWPIDRNAISIRLQQETRTRLLQTIGDLLLKACPADSVSEADIEIARGADASLMRVIIEAIREADYQHCPQLSASQRHNYLITACERLIIQGLDHDITLHDMARRSGYTLRSLELIFRKQVGMSPKRWFLITRLNGALRDLTHGDDSRTVSRVAMKWGFRHMSRFSEQFREAFGELPGHTLARALDTRQR